MALIASVLLFAGFYILYNTSSKVGFNTNSLRIWLKEHVFLSKVGGLLLLIASFYTFTTQYGVGAGIFIALVLLMVISSLIILLFPLKKEGKL